MRTLSPGTWLASCGNICFPSVPLHTLKLGKQVPWLLSSFKLTLHNTDEQHDMKKRQQLPTLPGTKARGNVFITA